MAQKMLCHFYARSAGKSGFFYSFNVEITGAARLSSRSIPMQQTARPLRH
ncbi:MAG: hypothetical protein HZB64_05975 [Rhodocyclales bacterium]|nr:hypothetical protein [Rhodocyclales bacterium]